MASVSELKNIATQVRRDIVRMVHGVKSGHPGGSLGCADYLTALYFEIMEHQPNKFTLSGNNEDVFVLSNGHISPLLYSVLARSGYFEVSELATFRKINSRLQGHPATHNNLPGVRIATGSLGQGLSVACGMALAKKMNNDKHIVYVNLGDGELQEGQNWEAIMYAGHHPIDNIIATVDYNNQQIDGTVSEIMGFTDLKQKWEAFNWHVLEMNGNDMQAILDTNKIAKNLIGKGKPIVILMKTEMGCGVDFMMGSHEWHGIAPNDEQLARALNQLSSTLSDY